MNTYQVNNRKNGFIAALAAAAAVAAFGLAGTPSAKATSLVENYWIGPNPGNGTLGGNWGTATNWEVFFQNVNGIKNNNWVGHWVPGSNGTGSYDSTIVPAPGNTTGGAGPAASGGYQDDEYINNGSTLNSTPSGGYNYTANPYTVTVNTNLAGNTSYRYLQINSQFNFGGAPQPQSPVTVSVDSGGYLISGQATIANGGIDATLNIDGGTAYINGGTGVGIGANYLTPGQATGYLDVSSGTLYTSNVYAGQISNGVVNLSGTGVINTNANPTGGNFYGGIDLGTGSGNISPGDGNSIPATAFYPGTGTMNQTGGTLDIGRTSYVGQTSTGIYNLSGGTINSFDGSRHFWIGENASGTLNVSGGTANLANVQVGSDGGTKTNTPNGLMVVSGGTVNMDSLAVGNPDNVGTGTLRITGAGGNATTVNMTSYANAVLDFQIGSSGVSDIAVNNPTSTTDGWAITNLSGMLQLDLLGGFTPTHGQTFTLLTTDNTGTTDPNTHIAYAGIVTANVTYNNNYSNVTNTGLNLDPADSSLWSWAVDPITSGSNITGYQLVATYNGASPTIPEPATLGLMAVGGLGILLLGKRRKAV